MNFFVPTIVSIEHVFVFVNTILKHMFEILFYFFIQLNNQQKHYKSYRYVENNNRKSDNKRILNQIYQNLKKEVI